MCHLMVGTVMVIHVLPIGAGQVLTGPLFNEPMRVETENRRDGDENA